MVYRKSVILCIAFVSIRFHPVYELSRVIAEARFFIVFQQELYYFLYFPTSRIHAVQAVRILPDEHSAILIYNRVSEITTFRNMSSVYNFICFNITGFALVRNPDVNCVKAIASRLFYRCFKCCHTYFLFR